MVSLTWEPIKNCIIIVDESPLIITLGSYSVSLLKLEKWFVGQVNKEYLWSSGDETNATCKLIWIKRLLQDQNFEDAWYAVDVW